MPLHQNYGFLTGADTGNISQYFPGLRMRWYKMQLLIKVFFLNSVIT